MKTIDEHQALQHPTWTMEQNIMIDYSTMINKRLEIIEDYNLFKTANIMIVLHHQLVLHSVVQY
ncbi:hypothetical protein [Spiroplasma endosymbiont of Polydrusus formosus]|uniref:hypothetical protein n=1 Tax=Spiroplasma endosymbiont of Polydrusus formosus TaxID=3139326 RepID=UPI0035B50367